MTVQSKPLVRFAWLCWLAHMLAGLFIGLRALLFHCAAVLCLFKSALWRKFHPSRAPDRPRIGTRPAVSRKIEVCLFACVLVCLSACLFGERSYIVLIYVELQFCAFMFEQTSKQANNQTNKRKTNEQVKQPHPQLAGSAKQTEDLHVLFLRFVCFLFVCF